MSRLSKVIAESTHFKAELIKSWNRIDIGRKGKRSMEASQASISLNDGRVDMHAKYKDIDEIIKLIHKTIKILKN